MKRRPRDTGPDKATRALVCAREGDCCASCGKYVPAGSWRSIQHRVRRQVGGNGLANLVLLCGSATSDGCHWRAEQRTGEMNERGYWLRSHEDPVLVPVMLCGGVTAWLTADGQYSTEPPKEIAS